MKQKTVEVKLKQGLEARPAAMLVQVASKHASNIYLEWMNISKKMCIRF